MTRALCRDCCEIVDGPVDACVKCGGARLLAHTRDRKPRHRPHRLRRLLRLGREARPAGACPRAADRRTCRRPRRGRHGLLHRPHLRGPFGHADVPGDRVVPARHRDPAGHGQVQARERADPRDLRVGDRYHRAAVAGRSLSRSDRRLSHRGTAGRRGAGDHRRPDRARDRHHGLDRPFLQQVPGQARLRAAEAARLLGHRPAPRPRTSWRRCRCARSTVSARSRRGAWRRAASRPSPTCRR